MWRSRFGLIKMSWRCLVGLRKDWEKRGCGGLFSRPFSKIIFKSETDSVADDFRVMG